MKTVIFDLGNVLVDVDFEVGYKKIKFLTPFSCKELIKILETATLEFNRGKLTEKQFFEAFNRNARIEIEYGVFKKIWTQVFKLKSDMYEYAKSLKGKCRLILASNTDPLHFDYISKKWSLDFFDELFLSYKEKEIKPNKGYFKKMVDKYSIDLSNTIFIDDIKTNVDSFISIGGNGKVFENFENTKSEIDAFLEI